MSNLIKLANNSDLEKREEEEKEPFRFDTIESIKKGDESLYVPEYNIKKDLFESMNMSILDKNNILIQNEEIKINNINENDSNFNNKVNNYNNLNNLDDGFNQSTVHFQDLPLNNNNFNNTSNNIKNNLNSQFQNKLLCYNNRNNSPYLEVDDAGEKKDM